MPANRRQLPLCDTLEREKGAAGDDLSIIDEAKHRQQQAREIFSTGDIYGTLAAILYVPPRLGRFMYTPC